MTSKQSSFLGLWLKTEINFFLNATTKKFTLLSLNRSVLLSVLSQGLSNWLSINVHFSVVRKARDFVVKMVSEFVSLVDMQNVLPCSL